MFAGRARMQILSGSGDAVDKTVGEAPTASGVGGATMCSVK